MIVLSSYPVVFFSDLFALLLRIASHKPWGSMALATSLNRERLRRTNIFPLVVFGSRRPFAFLTSPKVPSKERQALMNAVELGAQPTAGESS